MMRAAVAFVLAILATITIASPARAENTRVTGMVIDATTLAPIANADVELQNSGGGPGFHRTRTNAQGEFAIDGVATNRWYRFDVGAGGYSDWSLDSWQFPNAQREVRLTVPLDRAGRIVLRVNGSDGKTPVAGARVDLNYESRSSWDNSGRSPESRYTSKTGDVSFDGLRAGTWTVNVQAVGLRGNESRGVAVRRGETTKLALVMTRPASLSARCGSRTAPARA